MDFIRIRGARTHNLKSVQLELPRNALVVITGLSGSGKSSLAFDTLYAEGQRRYVESLSAYARQFLQLMEKPDVDLIEGLSPAIAIEQKAASHNPRSTVGTVTEIHDYLRLLFARVGTPYCPEHKLELKAQQQAGNWDRVLALIPQLEKRKVMDARVIEQLRRYATMENVRRKALDLGGLREYLERLAPDQRRDPRIAAAAAHSLIELGDAAEAHRLIEDSLEQSWDPALLRLYVVGLPKDARRHLERAEEWLGRHPGDAQLLLALGELCMHQELWGKARSYLEASLSVEPSHSACVSLGQLLERTGRGDEASEVYRRGLELALARLKEATGGRRRQAW